MPLGHGLTLVDAHVLSGRNQPPEESSHPQRLMVGQSQKDLLRFNGTLGDGGTRQAIDQPRQCRPSPGHQQTARPNSRVRSAQALGGASLEPATRNRGSETKPAAGSGGN